MPTLALLSTQSASLAAPTFTRPAGSNRLLVVVVSRGGSPSTWCTAVSYGGQSLTKLGSDSAGYDAVTNDRTSNIWYLLETGIAAATTSTLTFTGAASGSWHGAFYENADQVTPFRSSNTCGTATGGSDVTAVTPAAAEPGDRILAGYGTSVWTIGTATVDGQGPDVENANVGGVFEYGPLAAPDDTFTLTSYGGSANFAVSGGVAIVNGGGAGDPGGVKAAIENMVKNIISDLVEDLVK